MEINDMNKQDKTLEDALVRNNLLTPAEIESCLSKAKAKGHSLRKALIEQGMVSEKQIIIALSQSSGLKMLDLRNLAIDASIIQRVPVKLAWYYKIIPVSFDQDILTVASAFPINVKVLDEIKMHIGCEVQTVLSEEKEIHEAFKRYYGLGADTIDRILTKEPSISDNKMADNGQWIEDLEKQTEDPTVSTLVNQIILEAYKKRATDIHIEPYRDKVRFRYRIDGVLVDANLPDNVKHFLSPILSRIKILANLSITEKRLPQDGSAVVKTNEQQLDLRVSTIPTPRGESMVIRILPTRVVLFSLEKLGFNHDSMSLFRKLIQKPHGIIFITGPTGSGKTTTLYACLNEINATTRKIITIEDPVEYEMEGMTQVQVNSKVNFSFATGLRSILRHDPDILMVGEVRDPETAEIAIKTALTGHLVFSTLHTNDAASGVTRLIDMGIEPYLVASSVEAFVAQRLVRVICEKCKEEVSQPPLGVKEEMARSLKLSNAKDIKIYHGKGCDHCNYTGFYGRRAIYEILVLNDATRAAILEKPRSEYIKRIAIKEGMMTLRQNGWHAVMEGLTTPQEIMNVTVKDDLITVETKPAEAEKSGDKPIFSKEEEIKIQKIQKRGDWETRNQYDSRIYKRSYEPLDIHYRIVKIDTKSPDMLLTDGIEHSAVTEDISAGGVRFKNKGILPIGTIIELKLFIKDEQKRVECLAKVCRIEEDSIENIYTIMAYYLDISASDRVMVNRYTQKLNKDKEEIKAKH
jgi:type IV pilus assembly protein PilB